MERPPWGVVELTQICRFHHKKGKGLFSRENKPFCVPFGGDKRDRTADLLNAIQVASRRYAAPAGDNNKTVATQGFPPPPFRVSA